MDKPIKHPFGRLLRRYRTQAEWSQPELAEAAGYDRVTVTRAEGAQPPTLAVAQQLIETLDRGIIGEDGELIKRPLLFSWTQLQELAEAYLLSGLKGELRARDEKVPGVIGLILTSVEYSSVWGKVVGSVERHARSEFGWTVVLAQHGQNVDRELKQIEIFEKTVGFRGLILAPATGGAAGLQAHHRQLLDDTILRLKAHRIPVVFIDRTLALRQDVPFVGVDSRLATKMAVSRLIDAGHTRIAALIELPRVSPHAERLESFKQTLEDRGLLDPHLIKIGKEMKWEILLSEEPRYGHRRSRLLVKELLDPRLVPDPPTAIFCDTYFAALDVLRAVRELNGQNKGGKQIRIPEDLSVIGWDDVRELDLTTPKIARVYYDIDQLGLRALTKIRTLHNNMQDEEALAEDLIGTIPGELRIDDGESIAPPRRKG